jgi:hypothetical protein
MKLEDFNPVDHFPELKTWWAFWRWSGRVSLDILPDILPDIGYVVEKDGTNLCAGWLYTTNSTISFVEFIVSNPFAPKETVDTALDFLIECLSQRALNEGGRAITTTINSKTLAKRIGRLGFEPTGENLTQYVRVKWH